MAAHKFHQFRELPFGQRAFADVDDYPRTIEELSALLELAAQCRKQIGPIGCFVKLQPQPFFCSLDRNQISHGLYTRGLRLLLDTRNTCCDPLFIIIPYIVKCFVSLLSNMFLYDAESHCETHAERVQASAAIKRSMPARSCCGSVKHEITIRVPVS